jgi:hypothetical protein
VNNPLQKERTLNSWLLKYVFNKRNEKVRNFRTLSKGEVRLYKFLFL